MTQAAGDIARLHYRTDFTVDHKSDDSPVTIADRTIEQRLREIVDTARPQDGFLGEEFGTKPSQNGLMWVVDPIDGTKSFVSGRPSFGTLIALWEGNTPLLGLIYQPIINELWLGVKDQPTTLNDKRIKTKPTDPGKLKIGITAPYMMSQHRDLLDALKDAADFLVWGGDCYLYGQLAFGGLDMVIEKGLGTYDYAAIPTIVHGAGGCATDWQGNAMTLESTGDFLCTANERVMDRMVALIEKYT